MIVQASPPRTGSTLLSNILYGFLLPNEPIKFCDYPYEVNNAKIIKTHNLAIDQWIEWCGEETIFVCSERGENRINKIHRSYHNLIIVDYDELLNKSVEQQVQYVYNLLKTRFPFLKLNSTTAIKRVKDMNKQYKQIMGMPFTYVNYFYHIHGSHRNR